MKTTKIGDGVLRVMSTCLTVEDGRVRIEGHLDRKMYENVNKVLVALGGRWDRKAKAHVFEHPESIGERLDSVIETGEVSTARDLGWFPTPDVIADKVIAAAALDPGHLVLEPSAGTGALAKKIRATCPMIVCVEIHAERARVLMEHGFEVRCENFLDAPIMQVFDRVVMNPPFSPGRADIDHVIRAFSMLRPEGRLVAIVSGGILFREDKRSVSFRSLVADHRGTIEALPEGAFAESGTTVRTALVTMVR